MSDTSPLAGIGILLVLCAGRSMLIPALLRLMRLWVQDPDYSNSKCLMKLVNETSRDHFLSHRFYSSVQFDYDCDIEQYVGKQFSHGEFRVMNAFFLGLIVAAAVFAILDWKYVLSWRFLVTLFVGHHLCHLHHVFSHFGQDITFIVGNVMHHSDISKYVDESNFSFVDTIPQGFAISVIVSVLWACTVRALIPMLDPTISKQVSWKSLFISNAVFGLIIAYQVKEWHPSFHELANSSMESALPFTFEYMAYHHVFGHHVNGEWLGPHAVFDRIFNPIIRMYSFLHNEVLRLRLESFAHVLFAIIFDTAVSMLVVGLIWAILKIQAECMSYGEHFAIRTIAKFDVTAKKSD